MKIIVDAFGGDNAPEVVVAGAQTVANPEIEIILVGDENKLGKHLSPHISVITASEVIGMDESPGAAVRQKKNSSINVGMRLLAEHKGEAFFSAGNS